MHMYTEPTYTAHTMPTSEGDWQLVIAVRGLKSREEANTALTYIMGPFEDPEMAAIH